MIKKNRKDALAFDPQRVSIKGTITSNDRVLPSVEIIMPAQPPPCFKENLITGFVRSVPWGVASDTRRRSGTVCTLRDRWRPAWLRGYRRCKGAAWGQAERSQARRARCTTLVPSVYSRTAVRWWIVVIRRPDSPRGGNICGASPDQKLLDTVASCTHLSPEINLDMCLHIQQLHHVDHPGPRTSARKNQNGMVVCSVAAGDPRLQTPVLVL